MIYKMDKQEKILWKLQAWENFGFFIPDDRSDFGWDFFVNKKNFGWAKDWDLVKAVEIKATWKKPEVKIVSIKWSEKTLNDITIQWTFSISNVGEWGYIDLVRVIDGKKIDKWYFVHSKNFKQAKSWDFVKAKLQKHKAKLEAVIVKILWDDKEIFSWIYNGSDEFGFVTIKWGTDIFVPEKWRNKAESWDQVNAKIIDPEGRRPVWIITEVIKPIVKNDVVIEDNEDDDFED